MGSLSYKVVFTFGMLSLFHAAFSAAQHRTSIRGTELQDASLPSDITFQGLLSLVITIYGILYMLGDFKEIRAAVQLDEKSSESMVNRPSFYSFNHRGKVFGSEDCA